MPSERQSLLELNAQRQAKAIAHELARAAQNEASHQWRVALKAQHHREAPKTHVALLHR
jgi:hypothetical protein